MSFARSVCLTITACWSVLLAGCGETPPPDEAETAGLDIPALIAQLDAPNVQARYQAALELGRRGEAAIAPLEARLLESVEQESGARPPIQDEHDPREIAARTLQRIGEPAVPALLRALAAPQDYERRLAQLALSELGVGAQHVPRLLELLAHENPITAGMAAHHLRAHGAQVEDELVALYEKSDAASMKQRIVRTVLSTPSIAHEPWIERGLTSDDPTERLELLKWAAQQAGDSWIPILAARLGDPDDDVAVWASTSLSKRGAAALATLRKTLQTGTRPAVVRALPLIGRLGPQAAEAIDDVRTFVERPDALIRVRAILALRGLLEDRAYGQEQLLDLPVSADESARIEAAGVLAEAPLEAKAVTVALVRYVGHPELGVALRALESLGGRPLESADRKALEGLRDRFDDDRQPRITELLETS